MYHHHHFHNHHNHYHEHHHHHHIISATSFHVWEYPPHGTVCIQSMYEHHNLIIFIHLRHFLSASLFLVIINKRALFLLKLNKKPLISLNLKPTGVEKISNPMRCDSLVEKKRFFPFFKRSPWCMWTIIYRNLTNVIEIYRNVYEIQ